MQMKDNIIASNVAAGMSAAGGSMSGDIISALVGRIQFQLEHLDRFALALAAGMKLDGTVCRLMRMYVNSARGSFHAIDNLMKAGLGYTEYMNVLGAGEDHCTGGNSCPEVTAMGWQPVGTLTPIGSRKCMSNCLCRWAYRNSVTGEVWY